jgi:putative FmdB family regulatory protein
MPTYEYMCKSCGHLFEIVQSMRDDPLTECPECAGELRKVFAPPAISFKGSGFYATDHGKKKAETGAAKSDAKSGTGSSDSKSDQKTGEKKEASGTSSVGAKKDAQAPASSSTSKKEGGGGS